MLTSRRCAHEHPLMGALAGHPINDFITLGNDVLNGRAQIRECRERTAWSTKLGPKWAKAPSKSLALVSSVYLRTMDLFCSIDMLTLSCELVYILTETL
jgi:hypothetical protein